MNLFGEEEVSKEKWQEDEANITTESMENVEKRQQLVS